MSVEGIELEDVLGLGIDLGQGQQEVFGGDELVLHGVGFALGGLQHADQFAVGLRGRTAADLGQPLQLGTDDAFQLRAIGADLFQQRRDDAVGLVQQGFQQMERLDLRMALSVASDWALATASWPLIVSFSKRNDMIWSPLPLGEG